MNVQIRRASDRFVEREQGRLTRHAFSFGSHLDPEHVSFGPMVCHDDHLLGGGCGFDEHAHEGLEIVSWVVSGALEHTGEDGATVTVAAGECAVLVAGAGTRHAEHASAEGPCRFVQVWLTPGADGLDAAPSYRSVPVPAEPGAGLVAAPLDLSTPGARFAVARLGAGETLALPQAARVHAFVATGALLRSSLAEPLSAGDAFLLTATPVDADGAAPRAVEVTAAVPTELLVWCFEA